MKYDLVEIHWGDAWAGAGWRNLEVADDNALPCVSVGYLVRESKAGYILAGNLDISGSTYAHTGSTMFRPRGMVTKIKVIRKADKETKHGKDTAGK